MRLESMTNGLQLLWIEHSSLKLPGAIALKFVSIVLRCNFRIFFRNKFTASCSDLYKMPLFVIIQNK